MLSVAAVEHGASSGDQKLHGIPQPKTQESITVHGAGGLVPGTDQAQRQQDHRTPRAAGGPGATTGVSNQDVTFAGARLARPCPTGLPPH